MLNYCHHMFKAIIKNSLYLFCAVVSALFFLDIFCYAQEIKEMLAFTQDDRVLILAPHPDDEVIGAGGALQKALKAGAEVQVACFTNGDANELAFIVYEKRFTFKKKEMLHMGEVRRKETIKALGSLGLAPDHIVFLGYPDVGTMTILTGYWGDTKPYRSIFTRVDKVSYPEALSPNAPYVGESILKDLKGVILKFKPTKIFVSHPADTNRDHRALYLFLQIALWDLEGQIKRPVIFPYIIHVIGWPKPRGYHPEVALMPSKKIKQVLWQKLSLSDEEVKIKHDLIAYYRSQIEYNPWYLFTYARHNELFGDYPMLGMGRKVCQFSEGPTTPLYWNDIEMPQDEDKDESDIREVPSNSIISGLAYTCHDNNLWVRIALKRKIAKNVGVSVFLLGYKKGVDFAAMPKIRITIGYLGVRVKDKKKPITIDGFEFMHEDNSLILKVPFASLGNPDYILSSAYASGLPYETTTWRVLKIE